jgi:hypothetical protein
MHFPKCAGSFTEKLLKRYFLEDPHISFDKIDPSNVIWHQNVAKREKTSNVDLSGKSVICNFRRLPYWIISRINFEASRSGVIVPREMYIEGRFFEMNGKESYADKYLARYTERKVDHWIRVEYLQEDFFHAFSNYLDVRTIINPSCFKETVNVSMGESSLGRWFNNKEITLLYASNPKWTELENELYGNLLNGN